jgi:hypothetical protein
MDEDQKAPKQNGITFQLKDGYRKGCLYPTVTIVIGVALCGIALRYFFIRGSMLDTSEKTPDRDIFYDAQRDFSDGSLDAAAASASKILVRQPNHAPANQLMARIELTRGNRKAALEYLRRSLDSSLNREEVAKWISTLEESQPK